MQFHLYAIPAVEDASTGEPGAPPSGTLTCLLHVFGLAPEQSLEMHVNASLKERREGSTQLFSWRMRALSDEIVLRVRSNATPPLLWRGIWKGDAIFHVGTLPVQIFFNGVEQAALQPSSRLLPVPIPGEPAAVNGHHPERVPAAVVVASAVQEERPSSTETTVSSKDAGPDVQACHTDEEHEDDEEVWEDEDEEEEDEYWEEDEEESEEEDEYWEENEDDDEEDDEEPVEADDEDEPCEEDEDEPSDVNTPDPAPSSTPVPQHAVLTVSEEDMPGPASLDASNAPSELEASAPAAVVRQDAGEAGSACGMVAAFHLDLVHPERTLGELTALLAAMPRKTVVVDLRPRRERQKEEYTPLSRACLRDAFGGKYWDRSQFITTICRTHTASSGALPQWEKVVRDREAPEGIPYLASYLRAGYSMIVMDAQAPYASSDRRAVVEALRVCLPGVVIGTLR